jgi:serine/threonine-protein kinase RsbW
VAESGSPLVLRVPARPEALEQVHALVARLWEQAPGVPVECRTRFETAVVEVAANVVEHAAAGPRPVQLVLRLSRRDGGVLARFEDDGPPAEVDLAAVRLPGDDAESGRGLWLARAAADELTYTRDAAGNAWSVTVLNRGGSPPR